MAIKTLRPGVTGLVHHLDQRFAMLQLRVFRDLKESGVSKYP
jgi:hypothetical protein